MRQIIFMLILSVLPIQAQITTFAKTTAFPKTTLISSGGLAAPTVVQGCFNYIPGGASSIACTFSAAVTAGDQLYFCVNDINSISATSWTGDSGTFTVDPGNGTPITNTSSNNGALSCVYVPTTGGGNTTITLTATGLDYPIVNGIEVHGGVFDQSDATMTSSSGAGGMISSNNITPTLGNSLLIGFGSADMPTISAGTNVAWTLLSSSVYGGEQGFEYATQATPAAIDAQMTISTAGGWTMHIVDFKP